MRVCEVIGRRHIFNETYAMIRLTYRNDQWMQFELLQLLL